MKLVYNNQAWDKTDREEVDLINKAILLSQSPIYALDSTYDASAKLLYLLEKEAEEGTRHKASKAKMILIAERFRDLATRVENLEFINNDS